MATGALPSGTRAQPPLFVQGRQPPAATRAASPATLLGSLLGTSPATVAPTAAAPAPGPQLAGGCSQAVLASFVDFARQINEVAGAGRGTLPGQPPDQPPKDDGEGTELYRVTPLGLRAAVDDGGKRFTVEFRGSNDSEGVPGQLVVDLGRVQCAFARGAPTLEQHLWVLQVYVLMQVVRVVRMRTYDLTGSLQAQGGYRHAEEAIKTANRNIERKLASMAGLVRVPAPGPGPGAA